MAITAPMTPVPTRRYWRWRCPGGRCGTMDARGRACLGALPLPTRRSSDLRAWSGRADPGLGLHRAQLHPCDAAWPGRQSELTQLPPEKVRCIQVEGSGCYGHNGADDAGADAALLAMALPGRPVRYNGCARTSMPGSPTSPYSSLFRSPRLVRTGRSRLGITPCAAAPMRR